jgi:uncharacterized membrane protein YdjX (TVP38/TMEM64 family)
MMRKHLSKIVFLITVAAVIILFFVFKLDRFFTYENVQNVRAFILKFSVLGPLVILALYIGFGLAVLPTFFFIFLCGYLYGFGYGSLLAWAGMICAFAASFMSVRYIFRKDFVKRFGNNKIVLKLEDYVQKYHGWAVLFFRVVFIFPYNLQNIAYALTSIRTPVYVICSALGVIPLTMFYAWLGHLISIDKMSITDIRNIIIILSIVITIFASIFFTSILLRKKLNLLQKNEKSGKEEKENER